MTRASFFFFFFFFFLRCEYLQMNSRENVAKRVWNFETLNLMLPLFVTEYLKPHSRGNAP